MMGVQYWDKIYISDTIKITSRRKSCWISIKNNKRGENENQNRYRKS